jgi:hypothetical protein
VAARVVGILELDVLLQCPRHWYGTAVHAEYMLRICSVYAPVEPYMLGGKYPGVISAV